MSHGIGGDHRIKHSLVSDDACFVVHALARSAGLRAASIGGAGWCHDASAPKVVGRPIFAEGIDRVHFGGKGTGEVEAGEDAESHFSP
jgi:hypothetical protein